MLNTCKFRCAGRKWSCPLTSRTPSGVSDCCATLCNPAWMQWHYTSSAIVNTHNCLLQLALTPKQNHVSSWCVSSTAVRPAVAGAWCVVNSSPHLLKYLTSWSVSYRSTRATKMPGMTMSPRPSMEKGVILLPSSRALGNSSLMGASNDLACNSNAVSICTLCLVSSRA